MLLLLLLLFKNFFSRTEIPIFTEHPKGAQVREGESIVLRCTVECVPSPPLYQWFRDRTPLTQENNPQLVLKDIHQGHAGLYSVRATNPRINNEKEKHVFSKFAMIEVINFPVQGELQMFR